MALPQQSTVKPHTAGILSAITSIIGIAAPLAGYLPPKVGAMVAAAGIIAQAFTKPVTAGSTDLVPKNN